jgi:hypothetical protein
MLRQTGKEICTSFLLWWPRYREKWNVGRRFDSYRTDPDIVKSDVIKHLTSSNNAANQINMNYSIDSTARKFAKEKPSIRRQPPQHIRRNIVSQIKTESLAGICVTVEMRYSTLNEVPITHTRILWSRKLI